MYISLTSCNKDNPLQEGQYSIKILRDKIVYDNNNHAAFTGMIEYNGEIYLAFREGVNHASLNDDQYGSLTIMKKDGDEWKKMWSLSHDNMDLRDPYLIVMNGKLRLYSGFNNFDGPNHTYQHSGTAYSDFTGNGWTELIPVINDAPHIVWIWKIREYQGSYYGVGYLEGYKPLLMKSEDGNTWSTVTELDVEGIVSEADLNFMDDSLYVCLRKDEPAGSPSYWGTAKYPFKDFEWRIMEKSLACPDFFSIQESKQMWLTCREYVVDNDGNVKDIRVPIYSVSTTGDLYLVDVANSGGVWDKGYPSFCRVGDILYLSFYQVTDSDFKKSVIHVSELSLTKQ